MGDQHGVLGQEEWHLFHLILSGFETGYSEYWLCRVRLCICNCQLEGAE